MLAYMLIGLCVTALNHVLRRDVLRKTSQEVMRMRLAAGMSRQAALAWVVLVDIPLVSALWPVQAPGVIIRALDRLTGREAQ